MGRLPKIRAHYSADAQWIMRLAHAVELDRKRPKEWRRKVIERLQDLARDLLAAPAAKE